MTPNRGMHEKVCRRCGCDYMGEGDGKLCPDCEKERLADEKRQRSRAYYFLHRLERDAAKAEACRSYQAEPRPQVRYCHYCLKPLPVDHQPINYCTWEEYNASFRARPDAVKVDSIPRRH